MTMHRVETAGRWRVALMVAMLVCSAAAGMAGNVAAQDAPQRQYRLDYTAEFLPARQGARVTLAALPDEGRLKVLDFFMPSSRYIDVRGDGRITRNGDRVLWVIPRKGGALSFFHLIDHRRPSGAYDARITANWAIVRGDNLFPAAVTTATRDTDARARLHFKLPKGWNAVDTPYLPTRKAGGGLVVTSTGRSFDRPTGWIVAGKVGTRRENIDGTAVVVASPVGQGMRRMDIMAMVHWHLREMGTAFGGLPRKILIAGAGDPMWRGGLSGPRPLWMHSARPLISENGTSSLLHELTHVITGISGADGADWIAEGIAEFYSIEFMRRAGTVSRHRYDRALDAMRKRSANIKALRAPQSSGAVTARAVLLFADLDAEIRKRTGNKKRLDHVVRLLREENRVGLPELRKAAREVIGKESTTLAASPLLR